MRLGPLDKLRLELDEVWPHGASVTKDPSGRPFVAGLVRVMVSSTTFCLSEGALADGVHFMC